MFTVRKLVTGDDFFDVMVVAFTFLWMELRKRWVVKKVILIKLLIILVFWLNVVLWDRRMIGLRHIFEFEKIFVSICLII